MKRMICSALVLVLLLSACTTPNAEVTPTPEPTITEEVDLTTPEPTPTEMVTHTPIPELTAEPTETPEQTPPPGAWVRWRYDEEKGYVPYYVVSTVTWSFDEDTKTLTFSGEGSLPDGVEDSDAWHELNFEWDDLADVAETLVFEEGIIRIPRSAFYGFSHVTEVCLPSTLQIIEPWAFSGCAFEEISFPDGLEELGEGALAYCGNLLRCEIPASVSSLPEHLFRECRKLETVTLHEGLYIIGPECFGACDNLERLVIPASVCWMGDQNIPYGSTGIRTVVFLGPPPALMLEPDVGHTIMDCLPQNLTIYYPESEAEPGDQGKYWSDYVGKYDGYTWIEGVPEDMEKAVGLWLTDGYLISLISSMEIGLTGDNSFTFSDPTELSAQELYFCFLLLSDYDELEANYWDPENKVFIFTSDVITAQLSKYFKDFHFDITQAIRYDAQADAIVTWTASGFGGDRQFILTDKSLDGNTVTFTVDIYWWGVNVDEADPYQTKTYTIEFYDGGYYYISAVVI